MTYGLSAGGAVGVALETAANPGTWVTPAAWVPVLRENLNYTETRYYSEAIRQQTVANDVRQGYYHVAGQITMEVDTRWLLYFLHSSRWSVAKTGPVSSVYTYTFTPASSATTPSTNRTLSLTMVRNSQVFQYSGCNVTSMSFAITNGIAEVTMDVMGTTMTTGASVTPSFTNPPRILSAPCHQIFLVDGATTSGAISVGSQNVNFDGFTFAVNDNGAVQTRINSSRAAAYISFGITDITCTSSLDFLDLTEYTKFVNSSRKSLQYLSTGNTTGVGAGADVLTVNAFDMVYDPYNVELGAWNSLIMAQATLKGVASGGANPAASIVVASDSNITVS